MSTNGQNIDGFSTAISGLNAQQSKLELVGNNIANINTIGFKSSRMTFAEQFGSTMGIEYTAFKQGGFQSTGNVMDLGINGNSFFVLRNGDDNYVTRDGSFSFDKAGVLVNGKGYAVQGWSIDPKDSTKKSTDIGDIVIDSQMVLDGQATKNIWLNGNLNSGLKSVKEVWTGVVPFTTIVDGTKVSANLDTEINNLEQATSPLQEGDSIHLSGTDREGNNVSSIFTYGENYDGIKLENLVNKIDIAFGNDTQVQLDSGKILLTDVESGESNTSINLFIDENNNGIIDIPGFTNTQSGYTPLVKTSMVVYDSLGKAHELTIEYEKSENPGEWNVLIEPNGTESIVSGGSGTLKFDTNGSFLNFEYNDGSSEFSLDPGNGTSQMNISINMKNFDGFVGVTQFDSVSSLGMRAQDGTQPGELTGFKVDEEGILKGLFTNGETINLAQVGTARFKNESGLRKIGGSLYQESPESGKTVLDTAFENGSTINSGVLEMSNVDLANQFTQMIEAQRGFQATSRVVTTLSEVLNEASRLKR